MSGKAGGMGAAYRRARRREGGFALIAVMVSLVTLVAVFAGLQAAMLGPRLSLRALEREAREGLAREAALAEVRLLVVEGVIVAGDMPRLGHPDAAVREAGADVRVVFERRSRGWTLTAAD